MEMNVVESDGKNLTDVFIMCKSLSKLEIQWENLPQVSILYIKHQNLMSRCCVVIKEKFGAVVNLKDS